MQTVAVPGGRVAYDSAGRGPAVVFSHASLTDRRMWRYQFDALATGYRVVAFDRLGYGQSSPAPPAVRHGAGVLEVLDALGIERAVLVGSSMGGGYSLDAALLAPDRVRALALICPGVPGYEWPAEMRAEVLPLLHAAVPADRLAAYAAHAADAVRDDDVRALATMQLRYMAVGARGSESMFSAEAWALLQDMARGVFARGWGEPETTETAPEPPVLGRLRDVRVPTLVMNGGHDVRFIQDLVRQVANGIPGAQLLELPEAGHLPPVECPEAVTSALATFLDGLLLDDPLLDDPLLDDPA
jgi:pimeloyl-ACP methyl ester carboxylesterase